MQAVRGRHASILLPDGDVFAAGGTGDSNAQLASTEAWSPAPQELPAPAFAAISPAEGATTGPTEVTVSGRDLAKVTDVAFDGIWVPADRVSDTEVRAVTPFPHAPGLVDVAVRNPGHASTLQLGFRYLTPRGASTLADSAKEDHSHLTATPLKDGKVIVFGGRLHQSHEVAELFDPASGEWSEAAKLTIDRQDHTATLLDDGTVLIAGGISENIRPDQGAVIPDGGLATAEIYDPVRHQSEPTSRMLQDRTGHTATLLSGGACQRAARCNQVLAAGGKNPSELYDPKVRQWNLTGSMGTVRAFHTSTLLLAPSCLTNAGYPTWCGKVLAVGGNIGNPLASAELYDPESGAWTSCPINPTGSCPGSMSQPRSEHTASLLPDG
ncbi:MAG: kelch repeat-containing protein, partial [Actinomycetota bacterium]